MTDVTPIINAVIALLAAIVTAFLVPWIKGKTTEQERETLLKWVEISVAAAEQLFESTEGPDKLRYVMDFLENKGYSVDTEETRNAIEAAVIILHNKLKAG